MILLIIKKRNNTNIVCNVAQSAVLLSIKFFIILNIRSVVLYLIKVIYNRRHNVLQSAVRGTQPFGKRFDLLPNASSYYAKWNLCATYRIDCCGVWTMGYVSKLSDSGPTRLWVHPEVKCKQGVQMLKDTCPRNPPSFATPTIKGHW